MAAASQKKKETAGPKKAETAKKEPGKQESQLKTAITVAVPIIAILLIFYFAVLPSTSVTVPFTTFQKTYLSAPRVGVLLSYQNQSQYGVASQCATELVQIIAQGRNATTIDYYVLNRTECTYPTGGLGHSISIATNSTGWCINASKSEPDIFLNVSSVNSTTITARKLYVHGNTQYMNACPIAIEIG